MSTRAINTGHDHQSCDVCGRTLLRGEHAEPYLAGAQRRMVCELCAPRARHEGWVREGARLAPEPGGAGGEGRRRLLERLRTRRPLREGESLAEATASPLGPVGGEHPPPAGDLARGSRSVRAVPTGLEQRCAVAVELFNQSEHPRTVAGVARSLGAPEVSVRAVPGHAGTVFIVVAWELCWYRYEADLADGDPSVRAAGQGYELDELAAEDREVNAQADENGLLALL